MGGVGDRHGPRMRRGGGGGGGGSVPLQLSSRFLS